MERRTNFDELEFRCSQLGNLIPGRVGLTETQTAELITLANKPKARTEIQEARMHELIAKRDAPFELTAGTKTFLDKIFDELYYNRTKDVFSKEMHKGNQNEEDSLTLLSYVNGVLYVKYKGERFANGWIKGLPDSINQPPVVDTKTSWDLETYGKCEATVDNVAQVRGYMWLLDKPTGIIAYCLTNLPELMLMDLERKLMWQMLVISDTDPEYIAAVEKLRYYHNYDDMPRSHKVTQFHLTRDTAWETDLKMRITAARKYLNEKAAQKELLPEDK